MEKWKPLCKQDDKILAKEEEYLEKSSDDFEDYESDLEDLECLNSVKEQTVIEEDKEGNNTEMKIEKKVTNNLVFNSLQRLNGRQHNNQYSAHDGGFFFFEGKATANLIAFPRCPNGL